MTVPRLPGSDAAKETVAMLPAVEAVDALPGEELVHLLTKLGALAERARARLALRGSHRTAAEEYLTAEQVAVELGVDPAWVYRHAARWPFAVKLSGKVLRIERAGLRRWLAHRRRR